ncbi:MAG TPA: hypothetical protein VHD55_03415 [Candidatus Paceibacterota bacterium]|nr:hypothetical protein [Candidatus Paceibacterota bacterium]
MALARVIDEAEPTPHQDRIAREREILQKLIHGKDFFGGETFFRKGNQSYYGTVKSADVLTGRVLVEEQLTGLGMYAWPSELSVFRGH